MTAYREPQQNLECRGTNGCRNSSWRRRHARLEGAVRVESRKNDVRRVIDAFETAVSETGRYVQCEADGGGISLKNSPESVIRTTTATNMIGQK